jgi:PAS domain S-box-containing protein
VPEAVRLSRPQYALWALGVGASYVVLGKLGISLSVAHGVITPVWAPTGIAIAALLVFGRSLWPAVYVAGFLTNVTSGASPLLAAAIALGNTGEAVVAASLLRKARFRLELGRVRDVLLLVGLAGGIATLVSATNGVAVLWIAGADRTSVGSDWLLWWFGDAVGAMMVTPFLLLAFVHRRTRPTSWRLLEAAALVIALGLASGVVFLGGAWHYPYLLVPVLLWAALRFHQLGAAAASFLVGAIATWGTVVGTVPIDVGTETARVQIIQALVGVLAVSMLVLGATLEEREAARRSVEQLASTLVEAQALAHIGSWEWDLRNDSLRWSDELYRIYGIPQGTAIAAEVWLERIQPEDRQVVEEVTRQASADGKPFRLEYRIVMEDGQTRMIQSRGRALMGEMAGPERLLGTAQDVTEQRQAEMLRADILAIVSHELRTPLASILNFGVVLRESRASLSAQSVQRTIEQILGQARRIDRLLSDLLEIDRLRHGQAAPARTATNVAELASEVAETHRSTSRPIRVRSQLTTAYVDPAKIERVVDNLLANAVKHTPPDSRIALRLERVGNDLLIVVDDNGPGVPDEYKQAVFEIFDRGPKIMSSDPGSGIGLALVARFAALHGGTAWIEDSTSGGASVRVLLPGCVLGDEREAVPHI